MFRKIMPFVLLSLLVSSVVDAKTLNKPKDPQDQVWVTDLFFVDQMEVRVAKALKGVEFLHHGFVISTDPKDQTQTTVFVFKQSVKPVNGKKQYKLLEFPVNNAYIQKVFFTGKPYSVQQGDYVLTFSKGKDVRLEVVLSKARSLKAKFFKDPHLFKKGKGK